ncbi:MAG: hypothetical protein HY454_03620 [Parcubacteria group bacterium]|nr:hypothetical protein [Parcubacteria group bacterium]
MSLYEPKIVNDKVIILLGEKRIEPDEEDCVVAELKTAGIIPADIAIAPRRTISKPPPTILGVHMG